jgi:hypothetical protein
MSKSFKHSYAVLTSCVLACGSMVTGCAAGRSVRIPLGEWTGDGAFTFERWGKPEETDSIHREYKSRLCISKSEVDGQPATQLEVISEHGELPDLGPRTHMRLALVEAKRYCDHAVLYRVAGPLFDPNPEEEPTFEKGTPPVGASCMIMGGVTILQIVYQQGFVDTFRFHGRGLSKTGSLTVDVGSIHWVEALVQRKPADLVSMGPPYHGHPGR